MGAVTTIHTPNIPTLLLVIEACHQYTSYIILTKLLVTLPLTFVYEVSSPSIGARMALRGYPASPSIVPLVSQ